MSDFAVLSYFLAIGGLLLFIITIMGLILYFLQAYGLYKMAEKLELENSWLAFLPFTNLYIMGQITGPFNLAGVEVRQPELVLPLLSLASVVLNGIPLIGLLASIAAAILGIGTLYFIFKRYNPTSAVLYTVLSVIIPPLGAVFVFQLRNNSSI